MSRNKEASIILLDVGENTMVASGRGGKSFFQRAKGCVSKIIQKKIFAKPTDEIAVLLMGADDTFNDVNKSMGEFENIVELIPLQIPTWDMVRKVEEIRICENSSDWIDGVVVALNFARNETSAKKFSNVRIIVITNFITEVNNSNIKIITDTLLQENIELLAISDCIEHSDGKEAGHFSQNPLSSQIQTGSQKLFKDVVEACGGFLCHVDLAESQLLTFQKKATKSMPWNATLSIGSRLKINVSAYLCVQEEKFLAPFKAECIDLNTVTKMVTEYEQNNQQIDKPSAEDVIKAYMYGSSIVPLNDDDSYSETDKCLSCVGFTKKHLVLKEYLVGEGCHTVVAQKNQAKSAHFFPALVDAMIAAEVVMIARKIYRNGLKPIAVILQPLVENDIAKLTMIPVAFFNDITLFSYPTLKTRKNEPTKEQERVIKELVDAMDLMTALDDESGLSEAFSSETSLNPINQHLCRSVAYRALHPCDPLPPIDPELLKMIEVPEKVKQASKETLKEAEELFPLVLVEQKVKKVFGQSRTDSLPSDDPMDGTTEEEDVKSIVAIGTVSPAEDFGYLLKKGLRFGTLADQIQTVIYDLIFRTGTLQQQKILESIMMYREQSKIYSPFTYNNWIKDLKNVIVQRNKFEFWLDFIVKEGFGLIIHQEAPISSVTEREQREFYDLSSKDTRVVTSTGKNDDDLDALLD